MENGGTMSDQVNFVYDIDDDPPEETKHWLFLESVRLKEEKQELEALQRNLEKEKKEFEAVRKEQLSIIASKEERLERKKTEFNNKWSLLERETKRLADDQKKLQNDKEFFESQKRNFRKLLNSRPQENVYTNTESLEDNGMTVVSSFFAGCSGLSSLKRRYKDLMKIFHPDNMNGDQDVLLQITKEYEKLRRRYTQE